MGTAPWTANERWEFFTRDGRAVGSVTGRERTPLQYRLNPLWWIKNNYEQKETDADAQWFHPDWPAWKRHIAWNYLRNPLQNGNLFKWGIADRNYIVEVVEGWNDVMVVQRNDLIDPATNLPGEGYQKLKITLTDGSDSGKVYTWTNFCRNPTPLKKGLVWSTGHQATGLFELKYNEPGYVPGPIVGTLATMGVA